MATRGHASKIETLINEVQELEKLSATCQGDDEHLAGQAASTLDDKYRKWYATGLAVLPDDLHEKFRHEYEAGFPSYKIRYFLQDPRKESPIYRPDMDEASKKLWSRWQYPYKEKFVGPIRSQSSLLEQALARLGAGSATIDALELLEEISRRLPTTFSILEDGHRGRPGIQISDEYDVQHVLHAVTVLNFEEVEPEEPTPKMAGNSSRLDFLLKQEEVAIETKMTRKGLPNRKLREELANDIVYFRAHPHAKALFALVHDPSHRIKNRVGFERDLNGTSSDDFMVRVVITG